ncbi:MAG: energy transducer TonB [Proteobacteria bacterium]|nr:energy transducer TonB [Pseudomonadota bacterium]
MLEMGSRGRGGGSGAWPLAAGSSILLHLGLAAGLALMPQQPPAERREAFELTERQLPPPPKPEALPPPPLPAEAPPAEAPPPAVNRPRRRRAQEAPPPAPPPGRPEAVAPPAPDTGPRTFGIELEGQTAAPTGLGVALPRGDSLAVSPASRRVGRGSPAGRPGGTGVAGGAAEAPVPLTAVTTLPTVLQRAQPAYPQQLRDQGIEGQVVVELRIDTRGRVSAVKVLRGLHPLLDREALVAARATRFAPARIGTQAVPVQIAYTFTFVLD